jgi:hypothetical protein
MVLIGGGGVEERAAIQWERSMWLRKGGDGFFYEQMVMKEVLVTMLDRIRFPAIM